MNDRQAHPHELISAMLDGEIDTHERSLVESHLSTCAECRVLAADLEALGAALDDDPVPPVPAGLASRIGWRLRSADHARRRRPSGGGWPSLRMLTAMGGVAAALVLTVLVVREGRAPWSLRLEASRDAAVDATTTESRTLGNADGSARSPEKPMESAKASEPSSSAGNLASPSQTVESGGSGTAGGGRRAELRKQKPGESPEGTGAVSGTLGSGEIRALPPASPPVKPSADLYSPVPPSAGGGPALRQETPPQPLAAEAKPDRNRFETEARREAAAKARTKNEADASADEDVPSEEESRESPIPAERVPAAPPTAPPPPTLAPSPSSEAARPTGPAIAPDASSSAQKKVSARNDAGGFAVPTCSGTEAGAARRWSFASAPLIGLEERAEAELTLTALAARLGGSICAASASGGERLLVIDAPVARYAELRAGLAGRAQMPSSLTPPPAEGYDTVRAIVRPK